MALVTCKECKKEVSSTAEKCPHCGYKLASNIGCGGVMLILIAIGIVVSAFSGGSPTSSVPSNAPEPAAQRDLEQRAARDVAISAIKLEKFNWRKGGFDSVMFISGRLVNPTPHTVKDIEITCELNAKSGTQVSRNKKVLYETLGPQSTTPLRDLSMGFMHSQSDRAGCRVTDLVVVAVGQTTVTK